MEHPCRVGKIFDAEVMILELRTIMSAGYTCVLHLHSAVEEVTVSVGFFKLFYIRIQQLLFFRESSAESIRKLKRSKNLNLLNKMTNAFSALKQANHFAWIPTKNFQLWAASPYVMKEKQLESGKLLRLLNKVFIVLM